MNTTTFHVTKPTSETHSWIDMRFIESDLKSDESLLISLLSGERANGNPNITPEDAGEMHHFSPKQIKKVIDRLVDNGYLSKDGEILKYPISSE